MHSTQVYLLKLSNWTYQSGQQLTQGECLPSASMSLLNRFMDKPEQEPQLLLREDLMLYSVHTSTTLAKAWFTETRHSI